MPNSVNSHIKVGQAFTLILFVQLIFMYKLKGTTNYSKYYRRILYPTHIYDFEQCSVS